MRPWYEIENSSQLITPNLLIFPDRIEKNVLKMIDMAGSANRLRPHIKTHKMAKLIKMQLDKGIKKFKCATLSETELLATTKAPDILLAMQPVGIDQDRLLNLIRDFPQSKFSTIVDDLNIMRELALKAEQRSLEIDLWMDVNNGMNRTGISPGKEAELLYKSMIDHPRVTTRGFHVYDGHIHDSDLFQRENHCLTDFKPVIALKKRLEKSGYRVENMVLGGTPTFPIFKSHTEYELSPGTPVLWDAGYQSKYPDLDFFPAAVLATRIVSQPTGQLLCLDLGHKCLACEMPLPRARFLGSEDFEQISQSEEHLVIRTNKQDKRKIGELLYAIPYHVCPTVSKFPNALVVNNHKIDDSWEITLRKQF